MGVGDEVPAMAATSPLVVEGISFPAIITPPESSKTFFLGGAGKRGLVIEGKFVTFTAIGVYLESSAVAELARKWKGRKREDLERSTEFFRDIVAGPFEKFTMVTMVLPLTGQQYSEKVTENCVKHWKAMGLYTDAEASAIEKFREVFAEQVFPHGSSILFTTSPSGLTIAFTKDGSIPKTAAKVIENRAIAEAVLESIVGENGVSPEAKQSLASRLYKHLNEEDHAECHGKNQAEPQVLIQGLHS